MKPVIRCQHITRKPGTDSNAQLLISNRALVASGFTLNTKVQIEYGYRKIVILALNN